MKARRLMFFAGLAALLSGGAVWAQTAAPGAVTAMEPDAAKVAEYQRRFDEGYALEKEGQLSQARSVYEGILAEQPEAKRSLLEAGRVSLEMNDPLRAADYLERLHALVPDFPAALELLIQADQTLKKDATVERLVLEFRELHDSGKVPGFSQSLFFEREQVRMNDGAEIVFYQYFDYTKPPHCAVKAELFGPGHTPERVLLLNYDPEGTRLFHQKDPKAGAADVFILGEPIAQAGQKPRLDVYHELFATPYYEKVRRLMLDVFAKTPKPIYSAPVALPAEPGP